MRISRTANPLSPTLWLAIASLGLVAFPCAGADYWVSTAGSDGNPGSQAQPWRTIQRAVTQPVAPGDTVHVLPGTYVGFITDIDGTPGAPITWKAEGAGVVLNQPQNPPSYNNDNIRLEDADYNVIDGFELTGSPRAGIASLGDETNFITGVVVRNCNSHDNTRWGIFDGFANDVLYEYNTASGSQVEHGIYHSNSGDNGIIRYNLVYGNNAAGLHNNGDASLGGDGIISGMLIEGNVIYQNGGAGGAAINMDGVQDSIIRNNLIYAASASGIIGYQIDAADSAKNNVIVNNTVIMDDSGGRWALKLTNGSSGCTVFNNVLYRNHASRGAFAVDPGSLAGLTSDHNVVVDRMSVDDDNTTISLSQWQSQTGQDMNSILISPATLGSFFANPGGNDWHLTQTSPAVDAGLDTLAGHAAPSTDYEGDGRPAGGGWDIGADEYGSGGGGVTADFSGTPTVGPAPLAVQFTDLSTGSPTTWSWTFGDGATAATQNPSHSYASAGSYTVSLTVTSGSASDTETKPAYIVVTGSNPLENFLSGRGRGVSNPNDVAIHTLGGTFQQTWFAYGAGQWGTAVATGDIDGNSLANPLTGPGPGAVYGPQVKAFQPNGSAVSKVNFYAYGTLRYGVNVAGAHLDADGPSEIVTGAGPGAVFGPHVRGFNYDGATLTAIAKISFFAYQTLKFGVNVSRGNVDGDSYEELLTGPGPSGVFGPQVRGFNFDAASVTAISKINFNAFTGSGFGVFVAGGEVDGDAYDEIAAGKGPAATNTAQVRGFDYDGSALTSLPGFDTTPFGGSGGARPAIGDVDGDAVAELVAGQGDDPSAPPAARSYDYTGTTLTPIAAGAFNAFGSGTYGLVVATGVLGY